MLAILKKRQPKLKHLFFLLLQMLFQPVHFQFKTPEYWDTEKVF